MRDAIVIGGGVVGIACAHYLSESGVRVTVIDKGRVAGGCSHGNLGYICPSHVLPLTEPAAPGLALRSLFNPSAPFRVRPTLRPALWRWMWEFGRRCTRRHMLAGGHHLKAILDSSMHEYRGLIETESLHAQWRPNGLLYVSQTARGLRGFKETVGEIEDHFQIPARRIEGDELPSFDPALKRGLAGGYYYEGDATVRPDVLCSNWVARLRERRVEFIERRAVTGVRTEAGQIIGLETEQEPLQADAYVFAMGAWSPKLATELKCRIPIEPGKGYSVTMPRPTVCPTYSMLFPEHKVGVTPFEDGYRLGSMMEFAGYDDSIPEGRIRQLRRSAESYLVEPHTEAVEEVWHGWRPMTWDSLPIIGPLPRLANGILAVGHNMIGMSTAPATGRLVAEMLHGQTPHIDASAFSPQRFA